ncbi:MAG: tetratricopeptide repeat-containing glycosyltransferase family protein [Kovacikia sp.]
MQHHQAGHLSEAKRLYHEVLQQQPDQANALYLLGLIAHQSGELDTAIQWYLKSLASYPNSAETHNNLGAALQQQGKVDRAIAHFQSALRLKPNNPNANVNLGVILQQQGNLEAAIARFQKAIRLDPNLPEAHRNLAHALKEQGDGEQAISHYQSALQLIPNQPDICGDLADALQEQGRIGEAIELLDRAIGQHPNHAKLWGSRIHAKLVSGNLLDGFVEYDSWRLGLMGQPRPFTQPAWDGSELKGKTILLYTEAGLGLGDTIQFIRYAPLVAQRGGHVIVECQKSLVPLFEQIEGIATVVAIGEPLPAFDIQASLLSLPHRFATTLETIPAPIPYLSALSPLPYLLPGSSHLAPPPPKIGIVWGGDPNHLHDRDRSCPFPEFRAFLQKPGMMFYSLQKGSHSAELLTVSDLPIEDLGDRLNNFADTAAVVAQLDLVISVDTSVAHLAGAMGKPVWVMLPFASDWRWLRHRHDSPWYPTARLFRQSRRHNWTEVCNQIAVALDVWVKPA